jgi:hypothetical protein
MLYPDKNTEAGRMVVGLVYDAYIQYKCLYPVATLILCPTVL